MSDTTDDLDFDEDDDTGSSGGDTLKKLRALVKKQAKELAAAQEERDKAAKQARTSSLANTLKAKGVPVGLAKLYEGEDVSDTAVTAWLHEVKDDFGLDLGDDETDEDEAQMSAVQDFSARAPKAKAGTVEEQIARWQNAPIADLEKEGFFKGL